MVIKKILNYLTAYFLWIIVLIVALFFAIISQSTLQAIAAIYYIDDQFMREMLVRFLDKTYILILSLIWIILMVVTEHSFRTGVRDGKLLERFCLIFGIEVISIFIFDFALFAIQGWFLSITRIITLTLEILIGSGLLIYRNHLKKRKKPRST